MDLAGGGDVAGPDLGAEGAPRRRPVVQQLHMGRGDFGRLKRNHVHLATAKAIKAILFHPPVQRPVADPKTEQLRVKGKAPIQIHHHDDGMVVPENVRSGYAMPDGSANALREVDQLQRVPFRIAEFEGRDAARVWRQKLRATLADRRERPAPQPVPGEGHIAGHEGEPIPVFRNPLSWLRSGGGIVVLDWDWVPDLLLVFDLIAEDVELGNRLEAALKPEIWVMEAAE